MRMCSYYEQDEEFNRVYCESGGEYWIMGRNPCEGIVRLFFCEEHAVQIVNDYRAKGVKICVQNELRELLDHRKLEGSQDKEYVSV